MNARDVGIYMVIISMSVAFFSAYAQTEDDIPSTVIVTTDKQAYNQGDVILITGSVRDLLSEVPVTIRVLAPNGNMVRIDQIQVNEDKTFSTSMIADGAMMSKEGLYRVIVLYGFTVGTVPELPDNPTAAEQEEYDRFEEVNQFTSNEAEATFMLGGSGPLSNPTPTEIPKGYEITGGTITNIGSNPEKKAMVISLETTSDGELTITLLRSLINAVTDDGQDIPFVVLIDGVPSVFEEQKTSTERVLSIPFLSGAKTIEIIGTYIIPEFGPTAILIMIISIAVVIFASRKLKKQEMLVNG